MPVTTCPIEGFEHITVIYPDEWLYRHLIQFEMGKRQAPDGAGPAAEELFGTIALCEKIEGVDLSDIPNAPLHFIQFFNWLRQEVYLSYLQAVSPPKKKTS